MTVFQHISKRFSSRFFVLVLSAALIFKACSPDLVSEIGGGLQPEDEFIGAHFNNTHESLRLVAYTIADLPSMTSGRSFFALGSFNDPNFGTVTVDLITQIDEMFRWDTVRPIYQIDSVVIVLAYLNVYPFQRVGDDLDPITISIGELNEPTLIDPLTLSRTYFSNEQPRGGFSPGSIVSELTVQPNFRDSVFLRYDTIVNNGDTTLQPVMERIPILRIPIYGAEGSILGNTPGREFGRRLLETSLRNLPRSDLSEPSFLGEIPGLYFQTHPETRPGRGNVVNFDFTANVIPPQIRVHYRFMGRNYDNTEDSVHVATKLYSVGFWDAMTYNYVHFDRTTASQDLIDQLATPGNAVSGQNMVFLQAFFGTLVRVEMPDIRRLSELAVDPETGAPMRMVINQASLVLNPAPNGDRRFTPIPSLGIGFLDTVRINDSIMDVDRYFWRSQPTRDQGVAIGGVLDNRRDEYRIILTRHIQNLLSLDEESFTEANQPLTIFPANRLIFPEISAILGPPAQPTGERMRLEIVYSLIPK